MRIPHSTDAQQAIGISMTPMIDVVFLLLVFFICTASFRRVESVLPSPLAAPGSSVETLPQELVEQELERVIIEVSMAEGELTLSINSQPCDSLSQLTELLKALSLLDADLPVILDITGTTPLGAAIDVYDRCRLVGFRRIQFAARATSR